MRPLDVAVIGCGTAGAASALFLARAGHRVTVFEAVEEPRPIGAGIMVQPTGMSVLAALGLLEPIVRRGSKVNRLHCVTEKRRTVMDLAYADVDAGAYGLGLHRGVLFETLFAAADAQPGVQLLCGHPVEGLRTVGARRIVVEKDGDEHGPYDLVVVADGARSQLRDDAPLTRRATQYPWGALWFIAKDPEGVFSGTLFQVLNTTREMLGLLPSGLGPTTGPARKPPYRSATSTSSPLVSLFWSLRSDKVDAWRKRGLGPWKKRILELEPRTAPLLEQLEDESEVLFATYWDIVLEPWNTNAVVFVGDAAHATSPQLGQGANLALADAIVLSEVIAAEEHSLREALQRYSRLRHDHLAYYQWATRFLTPFFQSDAVWLGWLRDAFMGLSCKLPYARTRMIRTMCGLERGVLLSDSLPMPQLPRTR